MRVFDGEVRKTDGETARQSRRGKEKNWYCAYGGGTQFPQRCVQVEQRTGLGSGELPFRKTGGQGGGGGEIKV